MGGVMAVLFNAFFPNQCDFLVCIDGMVTPYNGHAAERVTRITKMGGPDFIKLNVKETEGRAAKGLSYDDIATNWSKQVEIDVESIRCLMKRGVARYGPYPDRYYLTRDVRVKHLDFSLDTLPEQVFEALAKRITVPHLFIKAATAPFYEQYDGMERAIEMYRKANEKFEWIRVDGGHHMHLTHPHLVSGHLSSFIDKCRPWTRPTFVLLDERLC